MRAYPVIPNHPTQVETHVSDTGDQWIEIKNNTFDLYDTTDDGESIETKLDRIINNGAPIETGDSAPPLYTERKQGVIPETNIRTDRFDMALDAHEVIHQQQMAKRKEFQDKLEAMNNPVKPADGDPAA